VILVSEAGFTEGAEQEARDEGAVPITISELTGEEPGAAILKRLRWVTWTEIFHEAKDVLLTIAEANDRPPLALAQAQVGTRLFTRDGTRVGSIVELMDLEREVDPSPYEQAVEMLQVAPVAPYFVTLVPPWRVGPDQFEDELFVRPFTKDGPVDLMLVKGLLVRGRSSLTVERLGLTPQNFGGQGFSYHARKGPRETLVFISSADDDGNARLSILQFPPTPEKQEG
jgi:hypothetical protein